MLHSAYPYVKCDVNKYIKARNEKRFHYFVTARSAFVILLDSFPFVRPRMSNFGDSNRSLNEEKKGEVEECIEKSRWRSHLASSPATMLSWRRRRCSCWYRRRRPASATKTLPTTATNTIKNNIIKIVNWKCGIISKLNVCLLQHKKFNGETLLLWLPVIIYGCQIVRRSLVRRSDGFFLALFSIWSPVVWAKA